MANTFKLKTKSGVNGAALSTVYTVPSSTTAVIIGLTISNIKGQSITTCRFTSFGLGGHEEGV